MEERAKSVFDRSFETLAREFDLRANVVGIYLPQPLFKEFLHLYHVANRLERGMTAVLQDGEHQLFLEEGRKLGFHLPDVSLLVDSLESLGHAVKAADPFGIMSRDDDQVSLSSDQAQGLLSLASKTHDVVHDVFDTLRGSNYMSCLRHFRDVLHTPYAGGTALKDAVSAYFSLCRIQKQYSKFTHAVHDERDRFLERKVEEIEAEAEPPVVVRNGQVHLTTRDYRL